MNISLSGKKVLVTGATGAIGRTIAQTALDCGAWVGGSYFENEAEAAALQSKGILMIRADLTDRTQARALVSHAVQQAGYLDALVYAAGNVRDHSLAKLTDQDWDQVMKLHLDGLFVTTQAVLPDMRDRRQGKIVAIGSVSGIIGRPGQVNYSAAKAGMIGFVKSLAKEAGRFGVTANVICPGFIDSKMTRSAPPEAWERAKADSALGILSSPDMVASFTAWLLSDLAQGVTGQIFHLDSRVL